MRSPGGASVVVLLALRGPRDEEAQEDHEASHDELCLVEGLEARRVIVGVREEPRAADTEGEVKRHQHHAEQSCTGAERPPDHEGKELAGAGSRALGGLHAGAERRHEGEDQHEEHRDGAPQAVPVEEEVRGVVVARHRHVLDEREVGEVHEQEHEHAHGENLTLRDQSSGFAGY